MERVSIERRTNMRKLYRSIARARMRKAGFRHINRPIIVATQRGPVNAGSFFSRNWKNYCLAPQNKED